MEKLKPNYAKKLAQLRYKDEILMLHLQKHSIASIAKKINFKLVRTNLKTTLSDATIRNVIKKYGSNKTK